MQALQYSGNAENHPFALLVKEYQAAMAKQDFLNAATYFQPDVTYTVPGNNRLSGTFKGPQEVMDYFGKLMELTKGTYKITDQLWLVNTNKVALITKNHAVIGNRSHNWNEIIIFEIVDNKKSSIEMFQDDQASLDEFYGNK